MNPNGKHAGATGDAATGDVLETAVVGHVDYKALLDIGERLLLAIGEDPKRPGVLDTPRRFANFWREFIEYEPGKTETAFQSTAVGQMVVVSGMRVWSVCEHHLLPFWADISVGYIADGHVLGLSKFARIAHQFAHKPQIQERLVEEIAGEISRITGSRDVAVLARGVHTCMVMRGIKTDGVMTSSVMLGAFRHDAATRAEFLRLALAK